jgi:hypothetical protein
MGWLHRDLFCMHSEGIDPSNRADFHRALSRLPARPPPYPPRKGEEDWGSGAWVRFREPTLRDLAVRTLRHLVAVITADSDLTKPPCTPRTSSRGPLLIRELEMTP